MTKHRLAPWVYFIVATLEAILGGVNVALFVIQFVELGTPNFINILGAIIGFVFMIVTGKWWLESIN